MDKVYVVTTGSYSDYGIARIFKFKEKAEEYARWVNDCRVEEYELSDYESIKKYNLLRVSLKWGKYKDETLNYSWSLPNDYDIDYGCRDHTWLYGYDSYDLTLFRYIEGDNIDKEFYEKKYGKAAYDIRAQIQAWFAEGLNRSQINDLLQNAINE